MRAILRNFSLDLKSTELKSGYFLVHVQPVSLRTKFHDSVVLKLAPAGGFRKAYLRKKYESSDLAGLEAIFRALFLAMVPRPKIESGSTQVRVEPLVGPIFSMTAEVTKADSDRIEWSMKHQEDLSKDEIRLSWSKASGLPVSVQMDSSAKIPQKGKGVIELKALQKVSWTSKSSEASLSDLLKTHPFEIDLDEFRRGIRIRMAQAGAKTGRGAPPATWQEFKERLGKIEPNPRVDPKITKAVTEEIFMQLTDALQGRPDLVNDAIELLKQGGSETKIDTLLGALGYEGSPKAQKAMLEFFQAGASSGQKQKIISAWAIGTTALIPEVKATLLELAKTQGDQHSNPATLALGASIPRDGDPETIMLFKKAFNRNDPLLGAGSEQEMMNRQVVVAGMGNARSQVFLPEIDRALRDPEPLVRAEAVNSLRFIPKEGALEKMFSVLEDSSEVETVRASAAAALKYRIQQDSVVDKLIRSGQGDPSAAVRAASIDSLLGVSDQAQVASFLKSRAQSDPDPAIRENLKNAGW